MLKQTSTCEGIGTDDSGTLYTIPGYTSDGFL